MLTIRARNVNEALYIGMIHMRSDNVRDVSPRGDATLEYVTPVATTYLNPCERVLSSKVRDANPFFHLMEALWILAGRQDVAWLAQFNNRMREYSDDHEIFHAPYGYRLRTEAGFDQIETAIDLLKEDPSTRRAVLQIWFAGRDLGADSKDIPCNDLVFCKIRDGKLNISVANRSNDMVWGAYGANAVQFSVIQEYMAAKLDVKVGTYTQVSDSFHVYTGGMGGAVWNRLKDDHSGLIDYYQSDEINPFPLVKDPENFDKELMAFVGDDPTEYKYAEPFLDFVAVPALIAWKAHKAGDITSALNAVEAIIAPDWRIAMREWLERRQK